MKIFLVLFLALPAVFGADPLYQSKGDHARTYIHPDAKAPQPYRVFVPSTWAAGKKMPLLVVLHGGGSDQNTPFERGDGLLVKEAEKHGYIVVSPLGGGPSGGYGAHYSPVLVAGARVPVSAPDAPAPNRTAEETAKLDLARRISESDVMMGCRADGCGVRR